jgi:hypothetical protein
MFRHIDRAFGMLGWFFSRYAAPVTSDPARATGHGPRKRCVPRKSQKPGLYQASHARCVTRRDCPKVFEKVAPHFHRLRVSRSADDSLPRWFSLLVEEGFCGKGGRVFQPAHYIAARRRPTLRTSGRDPRDEVLATRPGEKPWGQPRLAPSSLPWCSPRFWAEEA